MYAAKLAADAAGDGVNGPAKSDFARPTSYVDPSDLAADKLEAADAAFSATKLMAWLNKPANKARMYVRNARLSAGRGGRKA